MRFFLGIVSAIAGVLAGILGNILALNILYFFTRKGRKPTSRPIGVWVVFFISILIFVVVGSIAAFAPLEQEAVAITENSETLQPEIERSHTPTATATDLPPEATVSPTSSPTITPTPQFSFEKFDHFEDEELGAEYEFIGTDKQPEIIDGYLHYEYLGENRFPEIEQLPMSLIKVNLDSNELTFVSASIAVDDAAPGNYVFIQVAEKFIEDQMYYANFGITDTGEIFLAETTEAHTLGTIITTVQGNPIGEFNKFSIMFYGGTILFKANDSTVYEIDSFVNSLSLKLIVLTSGDGYIKTRWDYLGWSFYK